MSGRAGGRDDPRRRSLPLEEWPAADRRAWEAALRKGDLLDPGGPASVWSDATLVILVRGYGRWLNWLLLTGLRDAETLPADRLNPERVGAYVTELRLLNASMTVWQRVSQLRQIIAVLAPEADLAWLRKAEGRLQKAVIPVRNKRARLVPSAELVALGVRLMEEAQAGGASPYLRALKYRDGLLIALLAARPFRRGNFTSIEIGRHLVDQSDGYWLRFEGPETKGRRRLDAPFPSALAPYLKRYLADYRPVLVARRLSRETGDAPPRALWIGAGGKPLAAAGLSSRVEAITRRELGHAINVHLIRDCAATSVAEEDPEHTGIIRTILGHTTNTTAERCYTHAQGLKSGRCLQDEILRLRGKAQPRPAAARGGSPRKNRRA